MDEAYKRLLSAEKPNAAILTTDADTLVDKQWIAMNLAELSKGVDIVGGRIALNRQEVRSLEVPVRRRYHWENTYLLLLAKLESQLDPLSWDPWPRHHQNFCGSLAISAASYGRVGGVPAVQTLEDIALCKSVLETNGRIRHSPHVRVSTSARMVGRVQVGLSSHLQSFDTEDTPMVENAQLTTQKFKAAAVVRRKKAHYSEIAAVLRETELSWPHHREEPINKAIHQVEKLILSYS